jgi:hypothetical protein
MKRSTLYLAVALFLLPILIRGLWFYKGFYRSAGFPEIPDFSEIKTPLLPIGEADKPDAEVAETSEIEEKEETEFETVQGPLVLFDLAHDNQYQLAEIRALTDGILELGGEIESTSTSYSSEPLSEQLRRASAYVVIAPNQSFDSFDTQEIEDFVRRGGRMLVIIDPTRRGYGSDYYSYGYSEPGSSLPVVNELLESFQVRFVDNYLYNILNNEGNYRNVFVEPAEDHTLVEGIQDIVLYATHSIESDDALPILESVSGTRSSITDQMDFYTPALLAVDEDLLAIGDLTFLMYPYNQVADNTVFIANISKYLISGEKSWGIEDYPNFFGQRVELFTPDEISLEADTLPIFEILQGSLTLHGRMMLLNSNTEEITDHLRLSLMYGDEDLKDLLDPLGIVLPDDSELGLLEIPNFGDLNPSGLGLIALPPLEQGIELILVAEDTEGLETLVSMLAERSFYECLQDEYLILCKLGDSFDFGFDEEFFFEGLGSDEFLEENVPGEAEEGGS